MRPGHLVRQGKSPRPCTWAEDNIEETLTFCRLPLAHHFGDTWGAAEAGSPATSIESREVLQQVALMTDGLPVGPAVQRLEDPGADNCRQFHLGVAGDSTMCTDKSRRSPLCNTWSGTKVGSAITFTVAFAGSKIRSTPLGLS